MIFVSKKTKITEQDSIIVSNYVVDQLVQILRLYIILNEDVIYIKTCLVSKSRISLFNIAVLSRSVKKTINMNCYIDILIAKEFAYFNTCNKPIIISYMCIVLVVY